MRPYAKVSPRIWTGSVGRQLRGDPLAQALALYLITNPHANAIGLYHLPLRYIEADLEAPSKALTKALDKVCGSGFVRVDSETERVWIVEHARHEWPDGLKSTDNRVKMVDRLLVDHANSFLSNEFREMYGEHLSLSSTPSESPLPRPFEAPSKPLRSQKQEQEKGQEEQPSPPASDGGFDVFWAAWPRKVGKTAARKAWKQTRKERPATEGLVAVVETLSRTDQWRRDGGQYIPYPATWLQRGGWEDDPAALNGGKPPMPDPETESEDRCHCDLPDELFGARGQHWTRGGPGEKPEPIEECKTWGPD